MRKLTAILGTAFVMFVSVAAMDTSTSAQTGPAVKAAQHADHAAGMKCCDKAEGMCAREGKDGKDGKGCCDKPDCCKDDCCKDGKCKENCDCQCCASGMCAKHQGPNGEGKSKEGCCKNKPQPKKPILMASH